MAVKIVTPNGMIKTINDNFSELALAAGVPGVHTVTGGEATANAAAIDTGFPEATGFEVDVWRAGVKVTADAVVTLSEGVLTVADGGATYNVTTGDKIHWRVF